MQTNSGEFDSPKKLRDMITLLCLSNSAYEVSVKSLDDKDGVIHCDKGTICNAACLNLSGIDALIEIVSWHRGKYWVEELPIIPLGTMDMPLSELWKEVDKRTPMAHGEDEHGVAPVLESNASERSADTEPVFTRPSRPTPPQIEEPSPETDSPSAQDISENNTSLVENPAFQSNPQEQLLDNILKIKGVEGTMLTSVDGEVLAVKGKDPEKQQIEMIALLGEALVEIGETFGKGILTHGAIDFASYRVLIHPWGNSFVGTIIGNGVSAAVTGSEIEKLTGEQTE